MAIGADIRVRAREILFCFLHTGGERLAPGSENKRALENTEGESGKPRLRMVDFSIPIRESESRAPRCFTLSQKSAGSVGI